MTSHWRDLTSAELISAVEHLESGFAIYRQDFSLVYANGALRSYFPDLYNSLDAGLPFDQSVRVQVDSVFGHLSMSERADLTEAVIKGMRGSAPIDIMATDNRMIKTYHSGTCDGNLVGICVDITELRQREKDLKKARKDADAANQAKTDFLAFISHEIRTPLSGIFGSAQVLEMLVKNSDDPKLADMTDVLLDSTNTLMTLINDVLDLSKIEAGQMDIHPAEHELGDVLSHVHKAFLPTAHEKNLDFNLIVDKSVPEVLIFDPVRVRQCVSNLVTNALKFTHQGDVTIAAQYDAGLSLATIYVADTGIGIPTEEKDRLFEKFAQVGEGGDQNYGGTGLGLDISRRLARLMGGDITVVSEPGKGSVFVLKFECKVATGLLKAS